MEGVVKKYRYKEVNLTREAEVLLYEIKSMLELNYTNTDIVEASLTLMYKVLKKYKYKYLSDVVSHEV
jgi:hypothetical protein